MFWLGIRRRGEEMKEVGEVWGTRRVEKCGGRGGRRLIEGRRGKWKEKRGR